MIITILAVLIMFGLIMPLFWIIGTSGGIIHYFLITKIDPMINYSCQELGLTMADGGTKIKEEKK